MSTKNLDIFVRQLLDLSFVPDYHQHGTARGPRALISEETNPPESLVPYRAGLADLSFVGQNFRLG